MNHVDLLNNLLAKTLKIIGVLVFVLIITIFLGGIMLKSQSEKEIEKLFSSSKDISDQIYSYEQIKGLPAPVQRYLRYSLQENQPHIGYVRLKHGGLFRTKEDQKWMSIKGQEYFTVHPPGFVWSGRVPLVSAKDMYCDGRGNLKVKLLSIIKLVDAKGKETDQGELLRWLAETPWFPTALLPSEKLKWEPIDNNSAKVIFTDRILTVEGVFYFDEQGQITQFKTRRYKDNTLENWTGYYRDYREVEGIQIPHNVEVVWNLASGDFSYAKFDINRIEYNNPSKFK